MELLRELDEDYAQLEALIARINRTNSVTLVDGVPLSDLLARRDCMTGRLGILRGFLSSASSLVNRRTAGEIRQRPGAAKAGGSAGQKPAGAGRCHSGDKLDHRADGALTAKNALGRGTMSPPKRFGSTEGGRQAPCAGADRHAIMVTRGTMRWVRPPGIVMSGTVTRAP